MSEDTDGLDWFEFILGHIRTLEPALNRWVCLSMRVGWMIQNENRGFGASIYTRGG